MKNKKGFTLIELLAVIVILAIIALIATPIVLNMINSARKSAAKSSSLGFIDSIEYYTGFAQSNESGMDLGDYDSELLPTTNTVCTKSNGTWTTCQSFMDKVEKKSKGKAPTDAQISIDTAGKVRSTSWVKYNDYYCVYDGSDITGDCTRTTPSDAEVATDSSSSASSLPATIESCPGCKFVYSRNLLKIGTSTLPEDATEDYRTLTDHAYFLGLITNENTGIIERAFGCGVENGTPFCLEGNDTTKYASNITILNSVFSNCSSGSFEYCTGTSVRASSSDDGRVYIGVVNGSNDCFVDSYNNAHCRES